LGDTFAVLFAVCFAAAVGVSAWLLWRLERERRRLADQARARALDAGLLDAAPGGACVWSGPERRLQMTRSLRRMLGLDDEAGWPDLLIRLTEPDRQRLIEAVRVLESEGAGFSLILRTEDGRSLSVGGSRLRPASGETADSLWFQDASQSMALEGARARLERERDRLTQLVDCLPWPIWRRARDLGLAWVNRAYSDTLGQSRDAVLASELPLVSAGGEDARALAERAQRSGRPQSESHSLVVVGQRRLFDVTERPLKGEELVGYAEDVSALAETQDELARHVAAHAEVLQRLATAIAIYGKDKRLKFYNAAYVRLWRHDARWLKGEPTLGEEIEVLRERRRLPEYSDFAQQKQQRLNLFTQLIEPMEELMHLPDGTTLMMTVAPHPMGGLVFTYEDVTDRLALESSYNTLIAVQRETLDNLNEAIAVFGSDGRLRLTNPAFARMWDVPAPLAAPGTHVNDLAERMGVAFAGADPRDLGADPEAARDSSGGRIERRDGRTFDYSRVPLPDGATLMIYQDVTDKSRVERALRERNAALETADRLKSEFMANVSYELRTPLNAIIGFSELLTQQLFGRLNERQLEYAQAILSSSSALISLINDILDLATIEAGYMTLELGPIEIRPLLTGLAALVQERARSRELTLAVDCADDLGNVNADERRLKQALFNLVSNALKFTPPGGRITLRGRRQGDKALLSVIDTGVGIPEDERERVFGSFERGQQSGRAAGVGLGLSLVRSLVELHGGEVRLESEVGSGTTITCLLPVDGPAEAAQTDAAPAAKPSAMAGRGA
jgi:signal transduction histidine kinase